MKEISIRPYSLSDAPGLVESALESVAEVGPWLPWCHAKFSLLDAESWINHQVEAFRAGTAFQFVVVGKSNEYLGGCGLNNILVNHRVANLGYWIRTSASGRGVATTAVDLVASWAFRNTNLNRLEIVVALGNSASERVAAKVGAVREGVVPKRLWLHGESVDATMYAILRDE